jgi:hypothetical protein
MQKLPPSIQKFMPLIQQRIVRKSEEFAGEIELIFCYVILNADVEMSESGDVYLSDLVNDFRIELDFYWEKTSLAQAKYDKYPDYFPQPERIK